MELRMTSIRSDTPSFGPTCEAITGAYGPRPPKSTKVLELKDGEVAGSVNDQKDVAQDQADQIAALQELLRAKDDVLAQCVKRFQLSDARQAELTRRIRAKESELTALKLRLEALDRLVQQQAQIDKLSEMLNRSKLLRGKDWFGRLKRTLFRRRSRS
jgi:hypothetical protein